MAKVGAQRAAELTGRSKSTIQRSMKAGKLSYEIDGNDRRLIDVSELDRVFGLLPQGSEREEAQNVQMEIEKATQLLEGERLKMRIRMLEGQLESAQGLIEDLKIQRDQWQRQAQQVLLTSQYSQKQAEEYKEKLEELDRAARQRRQQYIEQQQRRQGGPASGSASNGNASEAARTVNENRRIGPLEKQRRGSIQSLWGKLRKPVPAETAKTAAK